ncbi:DUF6424 family protein [Streptomyces sp. NPDC002144]
MHHGGSLWVKGSGCWRMYRARVGIEWSSAVRGDHAQAHHSRRQVAEPPAGRVSPPVRPPRLHPRCAPGRGQRGDRVRQVISCGNPAKRLASVCARHDGGEEAPPSGSAPPPGTSRSSSPAPVRTVLVGRA